MPMSVAQIRAVGDAAKQLAELFRNQAALTRSQDTQVLFYDAGLELIQSIELAKHTAFEHEDGPTFRVMASIRNLVLVVGNRSWMQVAELDTEAAIAAMDWCAKCVDEFLRANQPKRDEVAREQASPVAQAIALMLEMDKKGKPIQVDAIAKIVGSSKSTLYRDPQFKAARAAIRTNRRGELLRGRKDASGNVEADFDKYDEED